MFGWDYPPGTEFDPRAPWNHSDEEEPDAEQEPEDNHGNDD